MKKFLIVVLALVLIGVAGFVTMQVSYEKLDDKLIKETTVLGQKTMQLRRAIAEAKHETTRLSLELITSDNITKEKYDECYNKIYQLTNDIHNEYNIKNEIDQAEKYFNRYKRLYKYVIKDKYGWADRFYENYENTIKDAKEQYIEYMTLNLDCMDIFNQFTKTWLEAYEKCNEADFQLQQALKNLDDALKLQASIKPDTVNENLSNALQSLANDTVNCE